MRYRYQVNIYIVALLLALGGISHTLLAASCEASATLQSDDRANMVVFIQDNQFDVDMATMAIRRSARKDVKELAEMIVQDHVQIGHRAKALQSTLGWKQASQGSVAILPARERVLAELQACTPQDFDDLYLKHERDFSQGFVHAMKTQWIPAARHPQFKAFLRDVAKQLDEHMAHMSHTGGTQAPHNPHGH